jgi:hypothetical protein
MRYMSRRHSINPYDYQARTARCYGCVRFIKNALKQKSPTCVWLSNRINALFNRIRDSIVSETEKEEAKRLA